jgi:hypothetical protein
MKDSVRLRTRHWVGAMAAAGVLISASACSSSSAPKIGPPSIPSPAPATSAPGPLSTSVPPLPDPAPQTAAALAQVMSHGVAQTGFAHISFSTSLASTALTGAGDVVLGNGQVTGLNVDDRLTGLGSMQFLLVNDVAYAKLPSPTKPGTRYTVVSSDSTDAGVQTAGIALQATKLFGALATYRSLVTASSSLKYDEQTTVGGEPALHYSVVASVSQIPSSDPLRPGMTALGVTSVRMDLWVDGLGRPLKVSAPLSGATTAPTLVEFSGFNRPVTLAAPPAAQVDPGH